MTFFFSFINKIYPKDDEKETKSESQEGDSKKGGNDQNRKRSYQGFHYVC